MNLRLPLSFLFLIALAALFQANCAAAVDQAAQAKDEISAKAELDNAKLTIGDRATYKITIKHSPKIEVVSIDAEASLRDFEIKDEKSFETKDKGTVTEGKTFVITNFTIGEYVLEPASISYRLTAGELKTIPTNKLYVSVETVNKDGKEPEDIRGIKGIVKLKSKILKALSFFGILLIIGLLAYGIWWKYLKKHAQALISPEVKLSPHEEAYRALDRLFDSDLLRRSQYKAYSSNLTEILKRYFERRYEFLALESTTYELLLHLKSLKIEKDAFQKINHVLNFCDLIKFAKLIPQPNEIIELNQAARTIIDLTKLIEQAAPIPDGTNAQHSHASI